MPDTISRLRDVALFEQIKVIADLDSHHGPRWRQESQSTGKSRHSESHEQEKLYVLSGSRTGKGNL